MTALGETATAFEPVAIDARYPPPRATVAPDADLGWLRRLAPVVGARKVLLSVSLVLAVVAMLAQVAVPAVVSRAIDEGLVDRTSDLAPFLWLLGGLALVRAVCAAGYRYGLFSLAYHIETDLRSIIYRHLTTLSFSFFDRVQSGQLISRANADIRSVQMFLAFAPLITLTGLSFVLALAFMLSVSIPLTLVAVLPLPAVYLLGRPLRERIFPLSWISQARQAELATIVDENVNGVRVVKSFAAEQRQIEQLAGTARRLQWANVATIEARARFAPLMENLPRIGQALVLGYGGWLVIDGQIQVGVLVAFNAYIVMMQAPFRLLGFFLLMAQRAAASAGRIYELLDERPELVDADDAGPDVLTDLSLTVDPGETVALVGGTGSGKSTVARLVPRFYDVRDGQILVDGHDVRRLTLTSLRSAVGLVLDEPFLFSASVRDNIAYGRPDAGLDEVRAAARAAAADEFITALPDGYDTVVGERGSTLSGGQRQRIAIARTLLVNPPVLVLDDATSAIDVRVEQEIHDALANLLDDRTTIVIAHRLSTISLADRVALLDDGRIVATGTHEQLLATEPRYRAVLAQIEADEHAPADEPVAPPPVPRPPVPTGFGGLGGLTGGLGPLGGGLT